MWKQPTEEDMEFVSTFLMLGLHHVSQLLRYCIPKGVEMNNEDKGGGGLVAPPVLATFQRRPSLLAYGFKKTFVNDELMNMALPRELLLQSQTKLLCRALSVGRKILKAVTVRR